ncbi:MAG: uroporphyrinogen-III C-methyltransferase [Dehalococcoidia bacterium]|nr:MAG: uroporphyrinogen-III C-methyltransferase [Dehalococcoidia bacterium]
MKTGKVYLVGAGPGDPGLVTLKGLECLKEADVIIYDRLLDERLLDLASSQAEKIYVGKVAGEHHRPQPEINRLLVAKAKEGRTVVRLKGGDPFVLGRGGEEVEALADNKISFEVVPGVTSAVAVPAYAGIPVTQRGLASSLAVITGHEDPGKADSSLNWEKLATAVDTLVFLMGMQNLPEIVAKLVEHGRPPKTPVAVIAEGTKPAQKTVVGELDNIATRVKEHQLSAPAVIVVGEVVRLREKLSWFENRPLFGKRILVTRARHQASTLSRLLSARGAQPVELPAIEIELVSDTKELDWAIAKLDQYQWLIFTSANGVAAFFDRLYALNLDARALKGIKISAIGPATAEALADRGIAPDYVPAVFTSEGIIAGLKSDDISGQRFLLPRADIADEELTRGITRLGGRVDEIAVYRTVPAREAISQARQMLAAGEIDVITFTSSSTVAYLMAAFKGEKAKIGTAKVACIGPKTADSATKAGLKVDILAGEQTIAGLVQAIEDYFREGA